MDTVSTLSQNIPISPDFPIPIWLIVIFIICSFGFLLYFALPFLSEQVSLLGIYHNLSRENIKIKRKRVSKIYFFISIPLIGSYWLILLTLSIPIDIWTSILVISTTMVTLLIIRVHGNPSADGICIIPFFPIEKKEEIIEQHRERILSFLFSLIAVQLIIALLGFGYMTMLNKKYVVDVQPVTILVFIFVYIVGLFAITYYGEYHLENNPPSNKTDCL